MKKAMARESKVTAISSIANGYFETLNQLICDAAVTDIDGRPLTVDQGFGRVSQMGHAAHDAGNKLIFLGNGGSAGIASHLAIDFSKNGGMRSLAFNDAAALTCLGNDLGYENVFASQLDFHARPGDLLIAISSSGMSQSILRAVDTARLRGCGAVTLSGFTEDNALRLLGDVNFYIRSSSYGFVEVAHMTLCHAILDLDLGRPTPDRH
ncbi:MAG TPA: SIS domain-containing protein [Alphaproteobacteria bacterium]|jgi:D-sedoheptulose 7-phosphate isomerase|nr:SIS domain-containing protein [Alphaproteobacteria bacterium]